MVEVPENPASRTEEYLAYMAELESSYPENPQSRVEAYLKYICENGGGGGGGGGDSISFHKLHTEYVNGDWVIKNDAGVVQTFADIDTAFKNTRKFVYMVHTNIVMIPAFSETQGFEFTGQYKLNGNVSNVRVIINSQNELHMDDDYLEQTYYKVDSMEDWDFDDPDSKPCYPTVEAVLNYISQHGGSGGVSDVTVNGTSIVQDGVAKLNGGSFMVSAGEAVIKYMTANEIANGWGKGYGFNNYKAVTFNNFMQLFKLAMTSSATPLTAEEQAAAQVQLGILSAEGVGF